MFQSIDQGIAMRNVLDHALSRSRGSTTEEIVHGEDVPEDAALFAVEVSNLILCWDL